MLCGGISSFGPLSDADKALFAQFKAEISEKANGAELDATEVASQVVNGTNYRFKANAGDVHYIVVVHKPIEGDASLSSVTAQPQ